MAATMHSISGSVPLPLALIRRFASVIITEHLAQTHIAYLESTSVRILSDRDPDPETIDAPFATFFELPLHRLSSPKPEPTWPAALECLDDCAADCRLGVSPALM